MDLGVIKIGIDSMIHLGPVTLAWHGITIALGIVVGELYYLMEHGQLLHPSEWASSRGFTFYGGFIAAALGLAVYVRRARLSIEYLDIVAVVLPLGLAVRRIGDVISGSTKSMMWTVIALLALGRFIEFFVRSDSDTLALGLETAQWTSLLLIVLAAGGAWFTFIRRRARA